MPLVPVAAVVLQCFPPELSISPTRLSCFIGTPPHHRVPSSFRFHSVLSRIILHIGRRSTIKPRDRWQMLPLCETSCFHVWKILRTGTNKPTDDLLFRHSPSRSTWFTNLSARTSYWPDKLLRNSPYASNNFDRGCGPASQLHNRRASW